MRSPVPTPRSFAVTPVEIERNIAFLTRRMHALIAVGESARPSYEHLRGAVDALKHVLGDGEDFAQLLEALRD